MNTKKISQSLISSKVYETKNICFLCWWNETNEKEFNKRKDVLSWNFNDSSSAVKKDSDLICWFCQDCLSDNIINTESGKTAGVRAFSFLVDDNWWTKINKSEREYYLFNHKFQGDFIIAFTDTGKKHISFKTKISNNSDKFYLNTEAWTLFFDRQFWYPIRKRAKEIYENKISKKTLLWEIEPNLLKKGKIELEDINMIKKYKDNLCYREIINVLQNNKI